MTRRMTDLGWMVGGAGTGLLIAFATRWYWGLLAFVMLAAVLAIADLMGSPRFSTRRSAR